MSQVDTLSGSKRSASLGSVRVAKYYPGKPLPETPDFINILIHVDAAPLGGDLSPYNLKNEQGHILENIWQFSKVYKSVSAQEIHLSAKHPASRIIWKHPAETHMDPDPEPENPDIVNRRYWEWREKGFKNPYAVRYPNGFQGRHSCVYSLWSKDDQPNPEEEVYEKLDYIQARKKIYCGEYARLAPATKGFKRLRAMLEQGTNLQIIEVDGPDPDLTFPPYDKISRDNPGLLIDEETIRLLVNDPRKPFGHGYTIAALLLDGQEWMK